MNLFWAPGDWRLLTKNWWFSSFSAVLYYLLENYVLTLFNWWLYAWECICVCVCVFVCMSAPAWVHVCITWKTQRLEFPVSLLCKGKHCRETVFLAGLLGDILHDVSESLWTQFLYVFIHLTTIYWVPTLSQRSEGLNITERVQVRGDGSLTLTHLEFIALEVNPRSTAAFSAAGLSAGNNDHLGVHRQ